MPHMIETLFLAVVVVLGAKLAVRMIRVRVARKVAKLQRKYRRTFGPTTRRVSAPRKPRNFISVRCNEPLDDRVSHAACNAKTCSCPCGHHYRNRPRIVSEDKPEPTPEPVVVDDPPFAIAYAKYLADFGGMMSYDLNGSHSNVI